MDVTDDDEVLQRHSSVAVYVCVDEGHTHQVLVVLEVPHEYLQSTEQSTNNARCCVHVYEYVKCTIIV